MINFVDDQVGRLIQYAGGLKNCLTVFTSDHGEMLGDHNLFRKTWPYEASARIPFLMRAPQKWGYPKEITCESPVGIQDIMPTILCWYRHSRNLHRQKPPAHNAGRHRPYQEIPARRTRGLLCLQSWQPLRYRRVLQIYMVFPNGQRAPLQSGGRPS